MLQGVLNLLKDCFAYVYQFYSKFMLSDTVSAWDFLLVCFVAGSIITLLIRSFGASGVSSGGSSAVSTIRDRNKESYDQYEKTRSRNEAYEKRYNSTHKKGGKTK